MLLLLLVAHFKTWKQTKKRYENVQIFWWGIYQISVGTDTYLELL